VISFRAGSIIPLALCLVGIVAGIACLAKAQSPAPSTDPADAPAILKKALLQLSDRDPAVRDAAREQLMGMSPTDLPVLRTDVEQAGPLPPGSVQALREVVTHVYLAGENGDRDTAKGFMGISMVDDLQSAYSDDDQNDSGLPLGVVVQMRLPGFDAYRALRDGDIILAIAIDGTEAIRVHSTQKIIAIISTLAPGQRVRLEVIRNGRHIGTTLTLNPKPPELDGNQPGISPDDYRQAQEDKAHAFWLARFAPVVDPSIS